MDYEKRYKDAMARLELVIRNGLKLDPAYIFPELAESDDERIRKALVWHLKAGEDFVSNGVRKEECIAYLEKQKENPKNADSIPSDCASDVKCNDRWYKVTNSTPADGRTVIAKDNIGNYLLASFAGGEWLVERYDLDDVPMRHTYVVEWCEIPSEKQKEQKPYQEVLSDSEKRMLDYHASLVRGEERKPFAHENDFVSKSKGYIENAAHNYAMNFGDKESELYIEIFDAYKAGAYYAELRQSPQR